MKTEDKVTSLELSKRIGAVDGPSEGMEYAWYPMMNPSLRKHQHGFLGADPHYHAFDCAELLDVLPVVIDTGQCQRSWMHLVHEAKDRFCTYYHDPGFDVVVYNEAQADTPAEALGKLLLWCLKEGHVKP